MGTLPALVLGTSLVATVVKLSLVAELPSILRKLAETEANFAFQIHHVGSRRRSVIESEDAERLQMHSNIKAMIADQAGLAREFRKVCADGASPLARQLFALKDRMMNYSQHMELGEKLARRLVKCCARSERSIICLSLFENEASMPK